MSTIMMSTEKSMYEYCAGEKKEIDFLAVCYSSMNKDLESPSL